MGIWMLVGLSAAVVGTSFMSGILGMAGGMVLMGILLAVMPVSSAMVLHGITQLASNGWRAFLWRKSIHWPTFFGFAMGAGMALLVLGWLQLTLSRPVVLVFLGLTPFLTLLLPKRIRLNVDKPGHPFACGLSCLSIQLLCGISGPLLDTFFLRSHMDRKAVVATKAATQTIGHSSKIVYFGALLATGTGNADWLASLLMIGSAMAGTSASRLVLDRMSDANFRNWTRRTVYGIGTFYLASGLWAATR